MTTTPPGDPDDGFELTRTVLTCLNDDGTWSARSCTSDVKFKIRAECLIPPRLVVPLIFVPGIMGTRLKVKGKAKSAAWFPPENKWEGLQQVLKNLSCDASDRQQLLNPNTTEVDANGVARPDPETAVLLGDAPGRSDAERGQWRGWGQLHGDSYGEILAVLEQRLARMLSNGLDKNPDWHAAVMRWQDATKLGAQKPFAALDEAALQRAASVFYPVHAVGYNWLQSNKASAERLASEIERICDYYNQRKMVAEKVILITHSMGGLVARACAELPGMQETILGIVHGVMPAIGAPATYKRMRAGFEGIEQVILGRNGAECTAVMANAPGPLELLPTGQYKTKIQTETETETETKTETATKAKAKAKITGTAEHWLRASHPAQGNNRDAERTFVKLGNADDPYTSIYLNNNEQNWWRLVKEELIDPAGREEREKAKRKAKREGKKGVEESAWESDFKKYTTVMEQVQELHDLIEDKYHPTTYAFYAADSDQPSWNEVHWQCATPVRGDLTSAVTDDDNLNGAVHLKLGDTVHVFEIDKRRGPGDGTVPEESGAAPTPHVLQIFRHEGKAKGHTSYDHQFAYQADIAQAVTLYSICRIVADSKWLTDNLHRC